MRQIAHEYRERGWSVIPTRPDKKPAVEWKRWTKEIASPSQVDDWFRRGNYCIGIICGEVSGLIVVDIERHGLSHYRSLPMTLIAMSQSGGMHWYYRWTDKPVIHNLVVASQHMGDVRSDGQYVLAPPSRGLNGEYTWLNRQDLAELPDEFLKLEKDSLPPTLYSPSRTMIDGCVYPSRSERLLSLAGNVVRSEGSLEDFKALALVDWAGTKIVEKGKNADAYMEIVFEAALVVTGSTEWRVAILKSVAYRKTAKGDRVVLQLLTDDGIMVYQGVTLIDGDARTEAVRRALPGLKSGKRCRVDLVQMVWRDRVVWRVRHFEPI